MLGRHRPRAARGHEEEDGQRCAHDSLLGSCTSRVHPAGGAACASGAPASDREIVEAMGAKERGISRAQVGLAWLRRNPVVDRRSA
jgi:hypothetical protein